jgi:RHS repeat-associated protein
VQVVISDKKIPICNNTQTPAYYEADVLSAKDYYPFGMTMTQRGFDGGSYKYEYNGQEIERDLNKDISTALFWEYDSRIGRRWNVDPVTYPWQSSYAVNNNNPIVFNDPFGLFGSRNEAREYKKEHDIKGRINKGDNDIFYINDHKRGISYFRDHSLDDLAKVQGRQDDGVIKSVFISAQSGGGDWLKTTADVFSAAGIGGTAKTEIIDFAVRDYAGLSRQSFNQLNNYSKTASEVRALGTTGAKYLRYSKGLGVVGNVVGVTSAGVQLIQNPTAGNATRLAVQGGAIGAAFIPVVGWGVSLGIGAADLIWGDDFYNWIDKR